MESGVQWAFDLEQSQKMLDESPCGIVLLDSHIIRYANTRFADMIGTDRKDILNGASLGRYTHPHHVNPFNTFINKIIATTKPDNLEMMLLNPSGSPITVAVNGSIIKLDKSYIQLLMMDITYIKRQEQASQYKAKLYSRSYEDINLGAIGHVNNAIAEAKRKNQHMALMYLSINNFRFITESYGYVFSDALLQAVTQRLRKVALASETVLSLGDDSFLIILHELENINLINNLMQKFINVLSQPYDIKTQEFTIATTAGIGIYPENGVDGETLFVNTTIAYQVAKQKGQKNYLLFTPGMTENAKKQSDLLFSLRRALEDNEFQLYYQPVLNCKTGKIVSLEALLRWVSNDELLLPSAFLSLAEESGLLLNICDWALQQAFYDNHILNQKNLEIVPISINLSNYQFHRPAILLKSISNALDKTGLNPNYLEFEISENITVLDFVEGTLDSIRKLGIPLTIDNFGASYVSLMELKRFNINNIKIDQTLITNLPGDSNTASVVKAIIAMAAKLDINIIAEGVETREQYEFLINQGCHLLQGNYICKPLSSNDLQSLLSGEKKLPSLEEQLFTS